MMYGSLSAFLQGCVRSLLAYHPTTAITLPVACIACWQPVLSCTELHDQQRFAYMDCTSRCHAHAQI